MKCTSLLVALLLLIHFACSSKVESIIENEPPPSPCEVLDFEYQNQMGCNGLIYSNPATTPYVIPFPPTTQFSTGLTNCSQSYHASGSPDQYATDFDLPQGTVFTAARGGTVIKVKESANGPGGSGNYLHIDHGDNTFGLYYHSPENGIYVKEGDVVNQGTTLGEVGATGLVGYPHLHFIVVRGGTDYPYEGIPVSFANVIPADVVLESYTGYTACQY
ncbi:MAG: M23 family metallopeptidase [Saprospiraceae bacterium]